MAPLNVVVFAATLKILLAPVKPIALERLNAADVFNWAVLLAATLFKLIPLVLVKPVRAVKSSTAVALAEGVILIFPPPDGPNAPEAVAVKVPALIVVIPVYPLLVPETVIVPPVVFSVRPPEPVKVALTVMVPAVLVPVNVPPLLIVNALDPEFENVMVGFVLFPNVAVDDANEYKISLLDNEPIAVPIFAVENPVLLV